MADLPFKIPKSLETYAEQFDEEPVTITNKLKNHLKKRGPDAVGYFLLAWFYHVEGNKDNAIQAALKARVFAPGSPLMDKLHYYLSHPDAFEAWSPDVSTSVTAKKYRERKGPEPVMDLDTLIARLSEVDSKPISIPEQELNKDKKTEEPKEIEDDEVDNIASETLAKIHEMQGKLVEAIETYRKLKNQKKEKADYFEEQIRRLKKKKEGEKENTDEEE